TVHTFFFSSRRRHTRWPRDWSSDVCSSDLAPETGHDEAQLSDPDRVNSDVSSVALNYGLPAVGMRSPAAAASANSGELTDAEVIDRKSTRLNSSHVAISYAVSCLKKKKKDE